MTVDDPFFQRVWDRMPAILHITKAGGAIAAVSDRWLHTLGYERGDVMGRRITDFMVDRYRDRGQTIIDSAFHSGLINEERDFVAQDGSVVVMIASALALRDDEGEVSHLLVSMQDVTARQRAERERAAALAEVVELKERLEVERDYLREEVAATGAYGEIVGTSEAREGLIRRIGAVASTDANVLIVGESGSGKELVARAIHRASRRADGPLVRVNCASVPRELFESEFFGHVKGAFTGAHRDRSGRFELARGGTLFLDEVGEVPLDLQSKLLRVLQEREFEMVGDARTRATDVRIVAATNRDLRAEVSAGRFREDLYYRLAVFPIDVPPLRARKEDVVPLAQYFLRRHALAMGRRHLALTKTHAALLRSHEWPGNVRELENAIERAVILSTADELKLDEAISSRPPSSAAPKPNDEATPVLTEKQMTARVRSNLIAALEATDWRVSGPEGAAKLLGIKATTLASRLTKLGIRRPRR